ncbi:TetR/AcrR family transcriptional regulator [Phytohabitans rumicis]|uniref:Putative transcriptional regulator, TetR family protein n=1 Tax=Phytohabitans rumicis TaxID=1076125 RepID=A0A6V8KUQ5_9ACTN|nr:TetR family transcriptional regulator [Phytohabitans rumicis]GFJ87564.1 putative transcriptional regulator, TetR family protein [Phytohabitans rumicis]
MTRAATPAPVADGEPPPQGERKGERTRRRILETARRLFAEFGYERATIRAIAAAAEVDKSSILQYFGSKQELFRAAVHWHIPIEEMTTDDPVQTVHNLMHGMLTSWAADPNSPMAVLLRASMTSEEAAELLRHHITAEIVDPVAATLDDPDAHLRAALSGAMMMGIAAQRYLLKMPYVADVDLDDILRLAGPAIRAVIVPAA